MMGKHRATSPKFTLSCLGAGKLGKTLCRLLADRQLVDIQQVINQSLSSSQSAIEFIGSGSACTKTDQLEPADLWLIAVPDDQISNANEYLQRSGALRQGTIVFHCSGSLPHSVLRKTPSPQFEIHLASVHPIHSFAIPEQSVATFQGTPCAIEGSPRAIEVLTALFKQLGAKPFSLDSNKKALYHAATVMACNNLVSLLEISQQMLMTSGIENARAKGLLEPIIRQTLDNCFTSGTQKALTGPVARGDIDTVRSHLSQLANHPDWLNAYSSLGLIATEIAGNTNQNTIENINAIRDMLEQTYER